MMTRSKYPFIYFFIEPNIVFVYKIETDQYVSVRNLSACGESFTYELKDDEIFADFDHEKSEPLVGRGYFVSMETHKVMAQKINELIRGQRLAKRATTSLAEGFAVHITSSESAAGSLRVGLDRPVKVIGLDGYFNIGPLSKIDSQKGRDVRNDWLFDHINFYDERYEYESLIENRLLEIEDIPAVAPIYIWTANNGNEQTGVRFFLQIFKDKPNPVYLVNTSDLFEKWLNVGEEEQTIFHTSEVHPEEIRYIFEKFHSESAPLTCDERSRFLKEWQELAASDGLLRLWQAGKIIDVPENYYDEQILQTISRKGEGDFIRAGMVIGEILAILGDKVGDSFFEYRIRELVYNGVLEMKGVPKSMRHYRVKLKTFL